MSQGDDILDRIWLALREATSRRTGFTLGFLATSGVGGGPRVRAVILRHFDQAPARINFATHMHSDKIAEIQEEPRVALTLYDDSVQLRIRGTASIADDAERRAAWEGLAQHSQQIYAPIGIPGEAIETAELADDAGTAFQRFALIRIDFEHLDWLDLAADPHQRWQFHREAHDWVSQRVVP